MLEGKYCKIVNKNTGEILTSGKIINHKDIPIKCISFDNRYYFNTCEQTYYDFIYCKYCEEIPFDYKKYINDIKKWSSSTAYKSSFIFRENDIEELDEEIKNLVYTVNKLNLRTSGSCSGHGIGCAWIEINFESFNQIRQILEILSTGQFYDKFVLTSNNCYNNIKDTITLRLETKNIGEKAYKDINYLTLYLNELHNIIGTIL